MNTFEAFGYTFAIDDAGTLSSDDADAATLRTVQAVAADGWASTMPPAYATLHTLQMRYREAIRPVDVPALSNPEQAGDVIY